MNRPNIEEMAALAEAFPAVCAYVAEVEGKLREAERALEHIANMEPVTDDKTGFLDEAAQMTARAALASIRGKEG